MGWREVLGLIVADNISGDRRRGYVIEHARIGRALLDMPAADRIALARELLAGTGRVVAVVPRRAPSSVECQTDPKSEALLRAQFGGWNLCRAAMLIDDTAREENA